MALPMRLFAGDSQPPPGDFVADMEAAGSRNTKPILTSGPQVDPLPWRGSSILQEASACNTVWKPFKTLGNATAVHSRNNSEYENYAGIDLEPDHPPWKPDMDRRLNAAGRGSGDFYTAAANGALIPGETGKVMVGECTAPGRKRNASGYTIDGPGGTWHTQRVGPFTSTGGYDWHQLSWTDPAFVSKSFAAGGGAAGVLGHFTGPTDWTGTKSIGFPPIHQHHVHIVPTPTDFFLNPQRDWTHNRLMVIHGDWTFENLGTGSTYSSEQAMGQDYNGYQKLIDQMPSINLELNDVRAEGSPPMTFYYQISLRLADKDTIQKARPLSFFKTHNVAQTLTLGGQSAAVLTYASYYDRDSRMWYSSLWPMNSTLVSVYPHFHQTSHQESFLFSSTPKALGIGNELHSPVDDIVTGDNAPVRAAVLRKAEELDALVCSAKGRLQRIRTDMVGDAHPVNTEAGACFDRAAYPTCYQKTWVKGEPFTVLTLNGPTEDCGIDRPKGGERNRQFWGPDHTAPQHSIFFISLVSNNPTQGNLWSKYVTHFGADRSGPSTIARKPDLDHKSKKSEFAQSQFTQSQVASEAIRGTADAKLAALSQVHEVVCGEGNAAASTIYGRALCVARQVKGVLSVLAKPVELPRSIRPSGESSARMLTLFAVFCFVVPAMLVAAAIAIRRRARRRQYEALASQTPLPTSTSHEKRPLT